MTNAISISVLTCLVLYYSKTKKVDETGCVDWKILEPSTITSVSWGTRRGSGDGLELSASTLGTELRYRTQRASLLIMDGSSVS